MEDLLGKQISHYRIIDFLSQGGMGAVYVGYDETLNRKVVLKSIREEHRLIAEAKTRFLREAQILSKLAHPNICQIFDYIEGEAADFLVLEMISGQSLSEVMQKGMERRQKFAIAEQIAQVLVASHEQGVIHRDLKPDNIMLTREGQVKVLDFGLSRSQQDELTLKLIASRSGTFRSVAAEGGISREAGSRGPSGAPGKLTEVGMVIGTIEYMSPEQARGEDAKTASDLYSFGLILQELFTGKPAYDRALGFKALLQKVTVGETLPVTGIDAHLAALIDRLKSPAPAARPTAVDLAERLVWIRNKPQRRRKKALLAAAIGVLAFLAVAMTFQTLRAVRAETSAREEARAAKQVSEFLVGLFQVADPGEAKGNTVTAREILDLGAHKIRTELNDQPLIQARLLDTMGNVYVNLGLFKKAETLLEKALHTRESRLPADHPDVATALNSLALLYKNQGRYAQAEPLYRRALAIREKNLGPVHDAVAELLNNQAALYQLQGRYAEAEPLYQRALDIRENVLGPGHNDIATSLNNLARLYYAQGLFDRAEPLFERALEIYEKALGPLHPDLAIAINNLAATYYRQNRLGEAESLFKRSVAIKERVLGPEHPDLATSLKNLSALYRDQGNYSRAEPLCRRSLEIREKALGADHPLVADSLTHLAIIFMFQGKYAAAEPLLRRGLAIREKALGPGHPDVAESLYRLAGFSGRLGRKHDALAFLRRALPGGGSMPWMQAIGRDNDLALLHGDPEFIRIVAEVKRRAASPTAGGN
ncbi:MAG TPA: serine/threonine-protein kinase [Candidatus Binatia bacterium]|nr:serine/threonine-protein kinase [Candidatus Binatia bacterium]